jgi:hypothetical protein
MMYNNRFALIVWAFSDPLMRMPTSWGLVVTRSASPAGALRDDGHRLRAIAEQLVSIGVGCRIGLFGLRTMRAPPPPSLVWLEAHTEHTSLDQQF